MKALEKKCFIKFIVFLLNVEIVSARSSWIKSYYILGFISSPPLLTVVY